MTLGCPAMIQQNQPVITPDDRWLGRVINAMGQPIDGLGPLPQGGHPIPLRNKPPSPHSRQRMGHGRALPPEFAPYVDFVSADICAFLQQQAAPAPRRRKQPKPSQP